MGASWLEIDTLIRELETLTLFPHSEALPAMTRARDIVAETAMVVSMAGLSDDPRAESEAQDLLEAMAVSRAGRARAQALIAEARAIRARDRSRNALAVGRASKAPPVPARRAERASAS